MLQKSSYVCNQNGNTHIQNKFIFQEFQQIFGATKEIPVGISYQNMYLVLLIKFFRISIAYNETTENVYEKEMIIRL